MTIQLTRFSFVLGVALATGACGTDSNDNQQTQPDASVTTPDAPDGTGSSTIALSTAGGLGAHLVDGGGKTLYFFANDVVGANASKYSGAAWPVFDAPVPAPGAGLVASDFTRFDRGDGVYQTAWKGRPLYYYASDTTATPTAGEGLGGVWFVAREYDLFFAAEATVTPKGATAGKPFLTNKAGRTLYVFGLDTRATGSGSPTTACTSTGCKAAWPVWTAPASLSNLVLPSTIQASLVTSFANPAASAQQFVFMGWPLYFYSSDTQPGQVAGASIANWKPVATAWNGTY